MKTLVLANQKGGVGKSAGATADALLTTPGVPIPDAPAVLVPAGPALLGLERQPEQHTPFARSLRANLAGLATRFDVCVVDTNPNPDIRVIAALVCADFVLCPIQLNQEALDGVSALLNHERVGVRRIKALLNPKLQLIGLLPMLVEPTPFQRANFVQLIQQYHPLLIRLPGEPPAYASVPRRSAMAEAQAAGAVLWEMKKTAARDAWREVEPGIRHIGNLVAGLPPYGAAA